MRILLTGASRGIGRAIAETLAGEGHSLALCASRPSDALDETVAHCTGSFGLTGDLGEPDTAAILVDDAVSRMGGLDAVISNAGIAISGNLTDMPGEEWDRVFDVNTRAPWRLA
ncbi:MAG: SDR family oxidoreductase, partial [Rhodobacteraceae bacterium]|nr:SDR family oxidoreductase [Paracoccaceae bacterium]